MSWLNWQNFALGCAVIYTASGLALVGVSIYTHQWVFIALNLFISYAGFRFLRSEIVRQSKTRLDRRFDN